MYTNYWIFAMIASYASFVSQTLGKVSGLFVEN